jgi:uncharacterized protein involved in exopolysaccharide biosynthesis
MTNENKDQELDQNYEEIPFKDRFKQIVVKTKPHLKNIWVLRNKFLTFNFIVLILTLSYLIFLTEPFYNSSVTILPDYGGKESSLGQLGGLAALAGVSVGPTSSTEIYNILITSESVLTSVIYSKYKTEKFSDSVNLFQYFNIKPDTKLSANLQERDIFIKVFNALTKGRLTSNVDIKVKTLTVSVKMPESQLSADVVNRVVGSLDNYIRTQRKSYASEQRQYIEQRLMQVKDSLNKAENKLLYFKEQNRAVAQSPELMLEQARLSRGAEIMNAVYLELSKQLEIVKISEVKDIPVLNIKELAKNPIVKTGPKRFNTLVTIMFLSLLFSAGYCAFADNIKEYAAILGLHGRRRKRKKV